MLAPNVEQIEIAARQLKDVKDFVKEAQMKELRSFGDARAQEVGASGCTTDFKKGYELGVQTARVVVAQCVKLIQRGIQTEDIL